MYKRDEPPVNFIRGESEIKGVTPSELLQVLSNGDARPKYDPMCIEVKEVKVVRKEDANGK